MATRKSSIRPDRPRQRSVSTTTRIKRSINRNSDILGGAAQIGALGGGYYALKRNARRGNMLGHLGGTTLTRKSKFRDIKKSYRNLPNVRSARANQRFNQYYKARSSVMPHLARPQMRMQAARLRFTSTSSFNKRRNVIDLRTSRTGSRTTGKRIGFAAGGALAVGGAALAARHVQKRRARRDYKGRFAGSY